MIEFNYFCYLLSMSNNLQVLISGAVLRGGDRPFLKHVKCFEDEKNGEISACSIGERWKALSQEGSLVTYAKGYITIKGANHVNMRESGECPYMKKFMAEQIMPLLKHPCDSGIVMRDGNINVGILTNLMTSSFEFDAELGVYYIRKRVIDKLINSWKERDADADKGMGFMMPNCETIAYFEWEDFFKNYTDWWVVGPDDLYEPAVTANVFLQFYFEGDVLYDRGLRNELPVPKPIAKLVACDI